MARKTSSTTRVRQRPAERLARGLVHGAAHQLWHGDHDELVGDVTLAGPDDPRDGLDHALTALLVRTVYAAAVGGTPEQWSELDTTMTVERHTAVLVAPGLVYPAQAPAG